MSYRLRKKCLGIRLAKVAADSPASFAGMASRGVGMMEFLAALLIFTVGMMGLLSAQVTGKKAIFEASQRSVATALVRDILERMRANPGQLAAYQVSGIGDEANRLSRPAVDCGVAACSAQQLAAFDLWQWESLLLGGAEQDAQGYAGGLLTPRACITGSAGAVEVTISWQGVLIDAPATESGCDINLDSGHESGEEGQEHELPQRHQLTVSTFMAIHMRRRSSLPGTRGFTRGLTLVELLVSLLLGLLLSAGMVSAYLMAKRNFYYEEEMARIQENGRYAMRILSRELAMAGFYGGIPSSLEITSAAMGADCSSENWALDRVVSLDLINDYAGQAPAVTTHLTELTCLEPVAIKRNTDLIAIKRTAAGASLLRGVPAPALTSSTVDSWHLRLIDGSLPGWEKLRPVDLRDASYALPSLGYWEAITRIFFVRAYSSERSDNIPSLCMEALAGDEMTTRCLVEGVENLQFEFGIDTDDDGVTNQYVSAPTIDQLENAVVARIHLLMRSIGELSGYEDGRNYRLGQKSLPATHDAYMRRVMSSTIVLRNHIAPGG